MSPNRMHNSLIDPPRHRSCTTSPNIPPIRPEGSSLHQVLGIRLGSTNNTVQSTHKQNDPYVCMYLSNSFKSCKYTDDLTADGCTFLQTF